MTTTVSRPPGTSSTTWAKEKIASFEPSVGITCLSGSSETPKRRPIHAGDRLAKLRQTDGGRVAHPLAYPVAQRLEDRGVGGLARVAHPEVDHLEALRARRSAAASFSRTNGYVAVARQDGGERHDRKLAEHDPAERLVGPHERRDLDALVDGVRVPRRARAEVDCGDPA